MNKSAFIFTSFLMILNATTLSAQQFAANYDEAKVPVYTLPDPLVFNNGAKVQNNTDWDKRRAEILKLFENEVYGMSPVWKGDIISTELSSNLNALDGVAIRKEYKLTLKNGSKTSMVCFFTFPDHKARSDIFRI